MNFVAGSLLLACATRDPAVGERSYPSPSPGHRRGGGSSVREASFTSSSWEEEGSELDGGGEDERKVTRRDGTGWDGTGWYGMGWGI